MMQAHHRFNHCGRGEEGAKTMVGRRMAPFISSPIFVVLRKIFVPGVDLCSRGRLSVTLSQFWHFLSQPARRIVKQTISKFAQSVLAPIPS